MELERNLANTDQMKFIKLTICIVFSFIVCSCDGEQPLTASDQNISGLIGTWEGVWSWDSAQKSKIIINDSSFQFENFPHKNSDGAMEIFNFTIKSTSPQHYGEANRLCLLILLPEKKGGVPIYLKRYKNKGLVMDYSYNILQRESIRFIRQ